MAARSLNKVMLIGNLTRDPEMRFTSQGTPVCTFGLATNRSWVDSNNQKQEEVEFHRVVAWSKLAELCNELLFKGRKVYVEGRLQTRKWNGQDGVERYTTEVVIDEMLVLDIRRKEGEVVVEDEIAAEPAVEEIPVEKETVTVKEEKPAKKSKSESQEVSADDIPF
ncbi:single-stranded DNA-binding protein [Candidatus Beckwithbacteria bacterium]|nr:single-stranded DNA-binding protein [Candidatus Beckwithbacteria bacterium]